MWRKLFYAFAVLLWLAAATLALESAAAFYLACQGRATAVYALASIEQASRVERSLIRFAAADAPPCPPGLHPSPGAPQREEFFSLHDDAARQTFAAQREELVMTCDAEGRIGALWAAAQPKEVAGLAELARREGTLFALIPNDQYQNDDARRTLRSVLDSGMPAVRDFPVDLPDGVRTEAEFVMMPAQGASDPTQQAVVFARTSIYEELWFRLRPHVYRDTGYSGVEFWTNNRGFRDEDVLVPKPAGVYRIVCIGGSTTFWGPRNDLTYPNLLEKKLRAGLHTDCIEVVNAGVIGITSSQERARFSDFLALEPDLIIHYNFANDAQIVVDRARAIENERRATLVKIKSMLRHSRFLRSAFPVWFAPSPDIFFIAARQSVTYENMVRMCRMATDAGVPMAICSFAYPNPLCLAPRDQRCFNAWLEKALSPEPGSASYLRAVTAYNVAMMQCCKNEGALYVPVSENIFGGPTFFKDQCHMYLEAIDLKADIIFEHLKGYVAERAGAPRDYGRADGHAQAIENEAHGHAEE